MFRKLLTFAITVILLSAINLYAQPKGGRGKGLDMEKRLEELTEKLSLTDDQAASIKTILEDMDSEMKVMFENGRPDRDKMDELRTETGKKIMKILTEEQQVKYKELLEERESRMKRAGHGSERPGRPRD